MSTYLALAFAAALIAWAGWKLIEMVSLGKPKSESGAKLVRVVNSNIPAWPKYIWVEMVEYLPYEPANYVTIPGWVAIEPGTNLAEDEASYYIEEPDGRVTYNSGGQLSDTYVGYCPSITAWVDAHEAMELDEDELNDSDRIGLIYAKYNL